MLVGDWGKKKGTNYARANPKNEVAIRARDRAAGGNHNNAAIIQREIIYLFPREIPRFVCFNSFRLAVRRVMYTLICR